MSKKKFNDKVELFHEVKDHLEQLFTQLESAEVHFNTLEHQDYVDLVINPLENLIASVDLYSTNLDNGIYDISEKEFEEDFED